VIAPPACPSTAAQWPSHSGCSAIGARTACGRDETTKPPSPNRHQRQGESIAALGLIASLVMLAACSDTANGGFVPWITETVGFAAPTAQ
jgi:hypothetical protein